MKKNNSKLAIRYAEGDESVYVYTRNHNPTVKEVEEKIALMEGGESALLFSSGMAAINRQNENAMALAKELSKHKNVSRVIYPGLPSHPQHSIAKKQMANFGGMVTIEVKGGVKAAVKVCDKLRVAINAMSLGGVETLVSIPVYSSHIKMSKKELAAHGVTPGMIRISVGVEGIEDLIEDFKQALSA
ncbi:MAG: PLP-dependent transferase [Bacteroidota bacterium]|nr:PLP-dependent transferase [Bacteroidota bacterium]